MPTTAKPAPKHVPPRKPLVSPSCSISIDPADPEYIWILGRICTVCGPIAHIFQKAGYDIPTHAEEEQAWVIMWMLSKYQEHGENWRAKADEEIKAVRDSLKSNAGDDSARSD